LSVTSSELTSVSNLVATVFADLTEAVEAVLGLAQDLLGMGTMFVASADQDNGVQRIIAVREGTQGCGIAPGTEIPLHQTV